MVVITNPPFSLFGEFVAQLVKYDKKFLIIGNQNGVTYKEIFSLIKDNKLWLGYDNNKTMEFIMPDDYKLIGKAYIDENGKKHGFVPSISWFTNLDVEVRHEELETIPMHDLIQDGIEYPHYDNYNAIEVGKVKYIPSDYTDVMGVPITFLGKYNPNQFEIIGITNNSAVPDEYKLPWPKKHNEPQINGQKKYARILIRNKHPQEG